MLRQRVSLFKKLALGLDGVIIAAGFFASMLFRDLIRDRAIVPDHFEFSFLIISSILPVYLASLYYFRMYESFRTRRLLDVYLIIAKATVATFIIFGSAVFIFKFHVVSRIFIVAGFSFSALSLSFVRTVIMLFFRGVRRRGYNYKHILVVGTGSRAQHFMDVILGQVSWGYRIVGLIDLDENKKGRIIHGAPVLGTFEDINEILNNSIVDEVVFVVPRSWLNKLEELLFICESRGLVVHVAVDYFSPRFSRTKFGELQGLPFLTFDSTPDKLLHLMFKRFFDAVMSGLSLIILSPLLLIIAVAVKLTSRGPVLFRQQRVGLYGRQFTLYKFRTMVQDAEVKLQDLLLNNEMNGPAFKMHNDPRVTVVGRFLRKYSFDELPQLWNIFKGDMSIVGPRPPIPSEVKEYDTWQRRRLSMRPGLTCLWQVSGRNKIVDFDKWVQLDLAYIDEWSLALDFKIIVRTIPVSVLGIGAK